MDPLVWDDGKNAKTIGERGLGLDAVQRLDRSAPTLEDDPDVEDGERRIQVVGRIDGHGYAIVFRVRGDKVCLLSLRCAAETELQQYDV
jgi:uncharacterized DUF497 family protein